MAQWSEVDRFGNRVARGLPYARGGIVRDTSDDLQKLRTAWSHVERRVTERGLDAVYNLSGLERRLPWHEDDLPFYDDEIAPALFADRLTAVALEHLGGDPAVHDVVLCNRVTAALFVAQMVMVAPGSTVLGVSPRYSHPVVERGALRVGARFVDCVGTDALQQALEEETNVSLVVLTRLSVTYELLAQTDLEQAVAIAQEHGVPVLVDDAGGARVGPALAGQPRTLALGVGAGATGLDKYGLAGPRIGLLGGERELVAKMRARAFEYGLEARPMLYPAALRSLESYDADRVRESAALTAIFASELKARLGADRVFEAPGTAQIAADDILEIALERVGLTSPGAVVPYEATACLAMFLLRDYGVLTVHFAGIPPGNGGLLVKFLSPETTERFGGAAAFAAAIDDCLTRVGEALLRPDEIGRLLFSATPKRLHDQTIHAR